ncbi:MAG TPA: mechanosensitive ion channel domain-containing protein, partial [Terriglobales bacterium]
IVLSLTGLILATIAALLFTGRQGDSGLPRRNSRRVSVDQKPMQTARGLASQADAREEQRFARQALRLADHEIDLAFAVELRKAIEEKSRPNPEQKALFDRAVKAETIVNNEQAQVEQLKRQISATQPGPRQDALQEKLNLASAQLELDQDELEDAQGDLMRSGADPQAWLQRQFDRYQASQKEGSASLPTQSNGGPGANNSPSNLYAKFRVWRALSNRFADLQSAHDESLRSADALRREHDELEKQFEAQNADEQQLKQKVASQLNSGQSDASGARESINSLWALARTQKNLADLDKRVQDFQELADVYSGWGAAVGARQWAAVHGMLQSVVVVLLIFLLAYLGNRGIDQTLSGRMQERKGLLTLRMILRFAVQAVALLLIAFTLFGLPTQMATIVGLAGAGLTVALKDFIVAFFGWFVLMGKNGIRVGDWVEINGVVGEVVEINLLRTVLLETGNWTDTGHPTGRKVAFVNSYAIEGHFFNFSTSGQWLWDELETLIPSNQDPYPIIEEIQNLVNSETAADVKKAEEEWQRAVSGYRVQSVSAQPAINLKPTTAGVEVRLRYITNANQRYATRARLYQALVELLHGKQRPSVAGTGR